MLGEHRINFWAKRLKRKPVLAILCGFDPDDPPGVGTFYDFFDRINDGPWQSKCPHWQKPSNRRKGKKGKFRRNIKHEKEQTRAASQAELAQANETRVQHDVRDVIGKLDECRVKDALGRIEDILFTCAVVPSAHKGLLGDLSDIDVAGDGSAIPGNASGNGQPLCQCRKEGNYRCDCERSFSDPDAAWGWDSYHKVYFFGYRLHAMVTKQGKVELPLHVMLKSGNTPDVVMGIESMARLHKLFSQYLPEVSFDHAIFDKGYDAIEFHRLILKLAAKPVISLNEANFKPADALGIKRDEQGHPLCPGGIPMRFHGFNKIKKTAVFNCPAKRPGRRDGKLYIKVHPEECPLGQLCEPESKMGPLVYLRPEDDPRLNPAVPRDSQEYKQASAKRTCTERFNSFAKEAGGMGDRPYRRQHIFEFMMLCQALRRHALAWGNQYVGNVQPDSLEDFFGMFEGLLQDRQPALDAA
jgi:hypothetical protein